MGDKTDIAEPFKKWKRRFKKAICCGVLSILLAIALVIGGIALLVQYTKYWGDTDEWERHLAYTGLAFLLIGFFLIVGAIVVFIITYKIYDRMVNRGTTSPVLQAPTQHYAPGKAPYPQQQQAAAAPLQPSAPNQQPGAYNATDQSDVKIEVTEHHKF